MKNEQECLKFETQLDAVLEGEDLPEVREHASRCPACSSLLDDLKLILAASRQLPLEDPPPRVWARIRTGLLEERAFRGEPSGWQRWFRDFRLAPQPVPIVALVGLAMLSSAVLLSTRAHDPSLTSGEMLIATASQSELTPDMSDEGTLRKTIKEMETSYDAGKSKLDPSLRAVYEKSLDSLNVSIAQCRRSVHEEPSNDLAHEYLVNAYAQKADVLTSALEYEGR